MNRLYAIESTPTLTGAKADHRLPVKASEVGAIRARAVAAIGIASGQPRRAPVLRLRPGYGGQASPEPRHGGLSEVGVRHRQGSERASRPIVDRSG